MKHLLIRGLALSLGLLATSARGQEAVWRSTPARPSQASEVSAAQPIAIAVSRPANPQTSTQAAVSPPPVATLGRPQVIASGGTNVQPVSFTRTADSERPVVRGAAPDTNSQLVPASSMSSPSMGQGNWRRADEVVAGSRTAMETNVAPPANIGSSGTGGILMPAPTMVPDAGSVPPMIAGPQSSLFATNPDCGCGPKGGPVLDCAPGCGSGRAFVGGCTGGGCAGAKCGGAACGRPGMMGCDSGSGWGRYVEPMFAGMFGGGGGSGDPSCLVLNAESLLWWMKGDRTPPLAVAAPGIVDPTTGMGFIRTGTNFDLIGGQPLGDHARLGVRASAIWWFSEEHLWGLEVGGFFLGLQNDNYTAGGGPNTNPFVFRPFFDTNAGLPGQELVSGRGIFQGTVDVVRKSTLWGYDINLRRNLCSNDCFTMDLLFGFRQAGLDESLSITENLLQTAPFMGFPAGTGFVVNDKFSTSNRFYGSQVGLAGGWILGDWSLNFNGKVAIGVTNQTVDITGRTSVTQAGVTQTLPGGLLTQQGTNIGHYTRKTFGVIPEAGMTLGYNITDWWKVTAGYNFLYWNDVARPGDQINQNVNRTLLPFRGNPSPIGGAQPSVTGRTSDFFAHGVTFGMEFKF